MSKVTFFQAKGSHCLSSSSVLGDGSLYVVSSPIIQMVSRRFTSREFAGRSCFGIKVVNPSDTCLLACSRLRDGGEKSFSKKKCEKRAGAGKRHPIFPAATAPFHKSRASYFRSARFNTSALYYLRAWHRLHARMKCAPPFSLQGFPTFFRNLSPYRCARNFDQ